MEWLLRTQALFGEETVKRLQNATVAVLGLGGVGGSAAEALCRMGVGTLILVDKDTVDVTNLNRQLLATTASVGVDKVEAARQRLLSINPKVNLVLKRSFTCLNSRSFCTSTARIWFWTQ